MRRTFIFLSILIILSCNAEIIPMKTKTITEEQIIQLGYSEIKNKKSNNRLVVAKNNEKVCIENSESIYRSDSFDVWLFTNQINTIMFVNHKLDELLKINVVKGGYKVIENEGIAILISEKDEKLKQTISIININTLKNISLTTIDLKRNTSIKASEKLQEFNYLEEKIIYDDNQRSITINWEQGQYLYHQARYFIPTKSFSHKTMNVVSASELEPLHNKTEKEMKLKISFPIEDVKVLASSEFIDEYTVHIISSDKKISYQDVFLIILKNDDKPIYNKPLSEIFEYQDDLKNIITGKSEENTAGFIISTSEFSYDLILKSDYTISVKLRPSSFTTRYIK